MKNDSALLKLAQAGLLFGVTCLLGMVSPAMAEPFPPNVIRIVVPTAPSTPPDILSRVVAAQLTETQGWKVIVENRPGAVMTVAGSDVLKQKPDGTTIYAMSVPVTAAAAFLPSMPFQLDRDFAPVIKISTSYNVLVVNPAVAATTVSELVALIKSQPDRLTFSSGGFGTPAHLIGEMFKLKTGVRATHIPYQQFSQAIGDLLNGTNQYMFITSLPVVDLIESGKLRAIAVAGTKRIPALKDVPTVVEQGFPELATEDWVGFAVKAGTAADIVERLNTAVNAALATPKVREAFAKLGAEPAGGTAQAYGDLIRSQIVYWDAIVKGANIKMNP